MCVKGHRLTPKGHLEPINPHDIALKGKVCGEHIADSDLERYHLRVVHGHELAKLEEHLFHCGPCVDRAEETAEYVDAMRAAIRARAVRTNVKSIGSALPH